MKPESSAKAVASLFQDPMDALKHSEGEYADPTDQMTEEQRLPMLVKAPDPRPFGNR